MSETFLVIWECLKCRRTMSGFLPVGAPVVRRECGSNYFFGMKKYPLRVKKAGEIIPYVCKGVMAVKLDERPPTARVLMMERDPPMNEKQRIHEEGAMRGTYARKAPAR